MLEMFKMFEITYVEDYEKFGENDVKKAYYLAIHIHQKLIEYTNFPSHSCKKELENRIKKAIQLIEIEAPFVIIRSEFMQIKDCVERLKWQFPKLFPKG